MGEIIKSVRGRISSCEEGMGISRLWGRILRETRESNVFLPLILRLLLLLGRKLSGETGKEACKYEKENHDLKNGGGEEYQVLGNYIHPENKYFQRLGAVAFPPVVSPCSSSSSPPCF